MDNSDGERDYAQVPIENPDVHEEARVVSPDAMHERESVLRQLQDDNAGFVADCAATYPETTPTQRQKIMSYLLAAVAPTPALSRDELRRLQSLACVGARPNVDHPPLPNEWHLAVAGGRHLPGCQTDGGRMVSWQTTNARRPGKRRSRSTWAWLT